MVDNKRQTHDEDDAPDERGYGEQNDVRNPEFRRSGNFSRRQDQNRDPDYPVSRHYNPDGELDWQRSANRDYGQKIESGGPDYGRNIESNQAWRNESWTDQEKQAGQDQPGDGRPVDDPSGETAE